VAALLLWEPIDDRLGAPAATAAIAIAVVLAAAGSSLLVSPYGTTMPAGSVPRQTDPQARLLQTIINAATDGIARVDHRGDITTTNPAFDRIFGCDSQAMVGSRFSALLVQGEKPSHGTELLRELEARSRFGEAHRIQAQRCNGTPFMIDATVAKVEGGQPRFIAVVRDLTERQEVHANLALTERLAAVGELAAGTAHEINNPINTIINCAQLIHDGDNPIENATIIGEEGGRIAQIVTDLRQFARSEPSEPQSLRLGDVVDRTTRMMAASLKRNKILLEVINGKTRPVMARLQQLQQVLMNLLINAKDALEEHGSNAEQPKIVIELRPDERGAMMRVTDNGPGITSGLGNSIFEPFVTTKRGRGGTGLGLSISKTIIESFGGSLTVRSEEGAGAEFRVWLPTMAAKRT